MDEYYDEERYYDEEDRDYDDYGLDNDYDPNLDERNWREDYRDAFEDDPEATWGREW